MRVPSILPLALLVLLAPACGGGDDGRGTPADGRIPACLDEEGIDLFAVEADSVVALSWTDHTGAPPAGGYRVAMGPTVDDLEPGPAVTCDGAGCEHTVRGLENGEAVHFAIERLGADGEATFTSCTVSATPHALVFDDELRLTSDEAVDSAPAVAGALLGEPVYLAWSAGGSLRLVRSDDLGDSWSEPETLAEGVSSIRMHLADRSAVEGGESVLLVAYEAGGRVQLLRGAFEGGLSDAPSFGEPLDLGAGTLPDLAAAGDLVVVVWEDASTVRAARSVDLGATFSAPVRADPGAGAAHAPSVAADDARGLVYVGYHGLRQGGDDDVYLVRSTDDGASWSDTETRIDDDAGGQNQRLVSVAVDARTGIVSAAWEDRRGGSNVYFARSDDQGRSFGENLPTGAGLNGDQFTPRAVVDPGRNVYVVFVDSSDGRRPLFSRFNPEGSFDPPLEVSAAAGSGGSAASEPTVFVDLYGTVYTAWIENRSSPQPDVFFARAE